MTSAAEDLATLRRLDLAHHLPAQQNYRLMEQLGGSRIITRAEGCRIYDAEGRSMLDGMAGLWCVNVGYGREELARVAYEQMQELPFYNTFFRTATPPVVQLATKLSKLTGGDLQHFFFSNSGSEAIDTAFRLARHYWSVVGQPKRKIFISRWNAYHGSTVAGASLGGMKFMHAQGGLPIPGIEHVMQPYLFGEGFGENPEAFAERAAQAIEERILAVGPENVAAFIGEPVQGAGRRHHSAAGLLAARRSHLPQVRHPAGLRRSDLRLRPPRALVRLPALRLTPDIVTMAKGISSGYLPISATAVSARIVAALRRATTSSRMASPIRGIRPRPPSR